MKDRHSCKGRSSCSGKHACSGKNGCQCGDRTEPGHHGAPTPDPTHATAHGDPEGRVNRLDPKREPKV